MAKRIKAFVLSSTILAMLLFSAFGTITVHADDGSGTEAASAETTVTSGEGEQPSGDQTDVVNPAGDGSQPTDVGTVEGTPPADESTPTDLATVEAAPPTDGVPPTEETAPVTPTEPILEQVPDNMTVLVLNTEGEVIPLVSQEAADAIASDYDPIWCPAGQAPSPGANNCTTSFGSFDELLTFLQANEADVVYQQAGTIYIQQGQYQGGESSVDFNNYNFNNINNYDLTLQGGWDIVDNSVDPVDTTSFDIPIIVGSSSNPWIGSLTLNNINISGVMDQAGLTLYTQGDITLSNVAVTNSESGADLNAGDDVSVSDSDFNDNQNGGAKINAGGDATVSASKFNGNSSGSADNPTGMGLEVNSGTGVTLASVDANNNQRFGVNLQTTGPVTVTDSFFNGNKSYTFSSTGDKLYDGYGIKIVTGREVSLVNVEAEGNYLFGAHIEGADVAIDTGRFSNNTSGDALNLTGRGLEVISQFGTALLDVTANNNQLFGANIFAGDLVAVQQSTFNGHLADAAGTPTGGYGLKVVTTGNITVEDVTANNNYQYGAYLQGDDTAVEGPTTGSFFTGNGSGVMTAPAGNNFGYGLKIVSTGSVNLSNLNDANSEGNQLFGADITAAQNVSIVDAFFSRNQSVILEPALTFFGYGLTVVTPGDIFLNLVVANFNNLWGGSLDGNNVFISDIQFNNNISDSVVFIDDTGLLVKAKGLVDLYNVEAKENRLIGATIAAGGPVFVAQSTFTDNRGITCLTAWCTGNNVTHHGIGLQVTTPNLIMVSTTNASDNNLFGAQLNGSVITVTNSLFNNNRMGDGLIVNAADNVTLDNITATNNSGDGADVTGCVGKIVQVTGGTFSSNDLYGIKVINATLNLDGTQVFASNGAGNVFTDTGTCPVITTPPVATTTTDPSTTTDNSTTTDPTTVGNDTSNTPVVYTTNTATDTQTTVADNTSNTTTAYANHSATEDQATICKDTTKKHKKAVHSRKAMSKKFMLSRLHGGR